MAANNNFVKSAWLIMDELSNSGQVESALQSILEKLSAEFSCPEASLWLKHDADNKLYMIASKGNEDNTGISIEYNSELVGKVVSNGISEYVKKCGDDLTDTKSIYGDNCLAIPLRTPFGILGCMLFVNRSIEFNEEAKNNTFLIKLNGADKNSVIKELMNISDSYLIENADHYKERAVAGISLYNMIV